MKKKTTILFNALICSLLAFAPHSVLADDDENALRDASFERQIPPDQGGWILFGPSWFTADQARRGHQSMFNGNSFGVSGSFQELPAQPGSQWRLTGYGLTPVPLEGAPAFGVVQFSFFDALGNDLGTVETAGDEFPAKASNPVDGASPVGRWVFLDTGIATAPVGTATIQAFTLYVDFTGNFQGVFFDDLSLCALEDDDDDDSDSDDEVECKEFDDDDDSDSDDD